METRWLKQGTREIRLRKPDGSQPHDHAVPPAPDKGAPQPKEIRLADGCVWEVRHT